MTVGAAPLAAAPTEPTPSTFLVCLERDQGRHRGERARDRRRRQHRADGDAAGALNITLDASAAASPSPSRTSAPPPRWWRRARADGRPPSPSSLPMTTRRRWRSLSTYARAARRPARRPSSVRCQDPAEHRRRHRRRAAAVVRRRRWRRRHRRRPPRRSVRARRRQHNERLGFLGLDAHSGRRTSTLTSETATSPRRVAHPPSPPPRPPPLPARRRCRPRCRPGSRRRRRSSTTGARCTTAVTASAPTAACSRSGLRTRRWAPASRGT